MEPSETNKRKRTAERVSALSERLTPAVQHMQQALVLLDRARNDAKELMDRLNEERERREARGGDKKEEQEEEAVPCEKHPLFFCHKTGFPTNDGVSFKITLPSLCGMDKNKEYDTCLVFGYCGYRVQIRIDYRAYQLRGVNNEMHMRYEVDVEVPKGWKDPGLFFGHAALWCDTLEEHEARKPGDEPLVSHNPTKRTLKKGLVGFGAVRLFKIIDNELIHKEDCEEIQRLYDRDNVFVLSFYIYG